jgi:hypothetical protein
MAGTVSRFIGAGVGFARLVAVSMVKVVDMAAAYAWGAAGSSAGCAGAKSCGIAVNSSAFVTFVAFGDATSWGERVRGIRQGEAE